MVRSARAAPRVHEQARSFQREEEPQPANQVGGESTAAFSRLAAREVLLLPLSMIDPSRRARLVTAFQMTLRLGLGLPRTFQSVLDRPSNRYASPNHASCIARPIIALIAVASRATSSSRRRASSGCPEARTGARDPGGAEGKGFVTPDPPSTSNLATPPLPQGAPSGIPRPPASTASD